MEAQTASEVSAEVQSETAWIQQTKLVGVDGLPHIKAEPSHQRLDQLLQNMRYEITDERYGRMAESQNPDVHLETVEDAATQRKMSDKTRYAKMDGTPKCQLEKGMYGNRIQWHHETHCHKCHP